MRVNPDLRAPSEKPTPVGVQVAVTFGWVVSIGVVLFLARAPIVRWLDDLVPYEPPAEAEAVVAQPAPPPVVPPPPAPPPPEPLSRDEVAARLGSLPAGVLTLVEEARDEVGSFAGLGSRDAVRAQVMANRWQKWGVVWRNRVSRLTSVLPTEADCSRYAELVADCRFVTTTLGALRGIADLDSLDAVRDQLDRVEQDVQAFLAPPETDEAQNGEPASS